MDFKVMKDLVKGAADVFKNANKIQEYKMILEAIDEIARCKEQLIDKDDIIRGLRAKIAELEGEEKSISYEHEKLWVVEGESKDGPYCPDCHSNSDKFNRLQKKSTGMATASRGRSSSVSWSFYRCNVCEYTTRDMKLE